MEAPAPGRMPMMFPMSHERMTVGAISFSSWALSSTESLNFTMLPRSLMAFSMRIKTWDMEKSPIIAQVTLMPL